MHYEKFPDGTVKCIEDAIPFELPEGWEWVRLQSICEPITDGTHKTPQYSENGYVFLSSKNVTSGKIDWDNVMYIPEDLHNELYSRLSPQKNDILLAKNGTTGVAAIVDRDCVFDIYVSLALLRIVKYVISPEYLLSVIASSTIQDYFSSSLKGIGVPNLHLEHIRTSLIPVSPLHEKHRIVEKLNELLSFVDTIESDKTDLQTIIQQTKSKILDLAIRGKLVPQDPNDEPASVLLERIKAEKEELIKQGKIKRDKRESVIFKGEDNSYYLTTSDNKSYEEQFLFDLPLGWAWCSLNDIAKIDLGKTLDKAKNTGDYYQYLRSVNVRWGNSDLSDLNEMRFEENELERYRVQKYDLLICEGGDVGRSCVWTSNNTIYYQNALHRVRFYKECNPFFFMYYMMYYESKGIIKSLCKGVTIKHLTGNVLNTIPFALPPLPEQYRIVTAIETIFTQLDEISESLS